MFSSLKKLLKNFFRLRYFCKSWIEIGQGTDICPTTKMSRSCQGGGIKIGSAGRIGTRKSSYWAGYGSDTRLILWGEQAKIEIGDRCFLNGVNICCRKHIRIGDDCLFATGIQILDSDTHAVKVYPRTYVMDDPQEIIIGNHVWVGLDVIILKGTTIGDNCVIGAGSVVKGHFPANSVIAGNPAKVVKVFELIEG